MGLPERAYETIAEYKLVTCRTCGCKGLGWALMKGTGRNVLCETGTKIPFTNRSVPKGYRSILKQKVHNCEAYLEAKRIAEDPDEQGFLKMKLNPQLLLMNAATHIGAEPAGYVLNACFLQIAAGPREDSEREKNLVYAAAILGMHHEPDDSQLLARSSC